MFYKKLITLWIAILFVLSGCNSPVYDQTQANIAEVKLRTDEARHQSNNSNKPTPPLVVSNGMYVDKTPISLQKQPAWLKNQIIIRGDQLPFSYYARTIAGGAGHNILIRYQVGLDEGVKISINYSGTVKGALDLLAAKAGYVYTVNNNSIYWQAFVVRTFDIAFMPGSSDYMMGKAAGSSGISSVGMSGGSAGFGGSGGAAQVSAIVDDSAASQYSNLKATLSIWKDVEATIKQLMSPQGTVMVSESTTSVTVRDRPTNLELIARFIENLNSKLSRQVLVKVQVLDVTLSSDYNYGIDWNLMKKTLDGTTFKLNMNFGTPVSITPLSGPAISQTSDVLSITQTGVTAFNAFINSLTQQGKVSIVTEPRAVCLNNQVSVIRIVSSQGYLASVQTTTLAGSSSGGSSITSQLTPGTVTTGLTLYILPKILGSKIYLQVNADLSTNDGLTVVSSTAGTLTSDSDPTGSIIQIPNTTQKQFNQRSVINSGDTLILAGFRELKNETGAMQMFNLQALGGKGSTQQLKETIVLITPIILHGFV